MKYKDGKYHVELWTMQYLGGYSAKEYVIVNVFGESCTKDGITVRFDDEEAANKYCEKLNQCADGGHITNLM